VVFGGEKTDSVFEAIEKEGENFVESGVSLLWLRYHVKSGIIIIQRLNFYRVNT
jgi:hypothetical protein